MAKSLKRTEFRGLVITEFLATPLTQKRYRCTSVLQIVFPGRCNVKTNSLLSVVVFSVLIVFLNGCGGSSSSGRGGTPLPPENEAPASPISRQMIGPAGGTLKAFGNAVTLTVPPGALLEDTEISVRALAPDLAGTVGFAYEFEPDGLQFATPARLSLDLAAAGIDSSDRVALAYQDSQGRWVRSSETPFEVAGDVVSFEQPHFSRWAFYERWYLLPASADVLVNQTLTLTANYMDCTDPLSAECLLTPLTGNAAVAQWQVNGVQNGNGTLGELVPSQSGSLATYHAPAAVPAGNPVSVVAQVDLSGQGGAQLQLVSNVTVLPDNIWTGALDMEFSGAFREPYLNGDRQANVVYRVHQDFVAVMTEAMDDDGNGLVMLTLGAPVLEFRYHEVADDYYGGEDVAGCLRHKVITTDLAATEVDYSGYPEGFFGAIQFNINHRTATTPFIMPPPFDADGSRTTQIEGCGSSEFAEQSIPSSMLSFGSYLEMSTSAVSDDGKRFTAQAEMPTTLTVEGIQFSGMLRYRWVLVSNRD